MTTQIKTYLERSQQAIEEMPLQVIKDVVVLLIEACRNNRQVILMGNGGSSATASHFVNDLNKTAIVAGHHRFRAIALTDNVSLITAWANDSAYEDIFSQQMLNYVEGGDVVIAISESGNSANVLNAVRLARAAGAITIGMTGGSGGELKDLVDYCIVVPTNEMKQTEGVHGIIIHAIIDRLRNVLTEISTYQKTIVSADTSIRPAVFLDRDGVINENRSDYVKSWEEFIFLPCVFDPLKALSKNHHAIVIVSNQSAVGRGLVSKDSVEAVNTRMQEIIHAVGGRIDGIYYCPHRPDENCECRKPRPGLLLRAAQDLNLDLAHSFFIGDALSDVQAALAVGCTPIFVLTGKGKEELLKLQEQDYIDVLVANDLAHAVALVNGQIEDNLYVPLSAQVPSSD